jgi:hypothetical protein
LVTFDVAFDLFGHVLHLGDLLLALFEVGFQF